MRDPRRLRAIRDNRADRLTIGPEYQAHRDGRGGRSAVVAVLRNTGTCCPARRTRLDRLRCKARLHARSRVPGIHRACDLCACASAAELRREDPGANLADRRFYHHMPPLQASGDRTNAGERLPVLLRLQRLRAMPQADARGLLRVLFVRLGAVPADASRAAQHLSPKVLPRCATMLGAPSSAGFTSETSWHNVFAVNLTAL
jgi:hypothetical protein